MAKDPVNKTTPVSTPSKSAGVSQIPRSPHTRNLSVCVVLRNATDLFNYFLERGVGLGELKSHRNAPAYRIPDDRWQEQWSFPKEVEYLRAITGAITIESSFGFWETRRVCQANRGTRRRGGEANDEKFSKYRNTIFGTLDSSRSRGWPF